MEILKKLSFLKFPNNNSVGATSLKILASIVAVQF